MELFSAAESNEKAPLAYRMSPRNLDEYIGQSHIVGPGRLLRRVIQADRLSSLIFYGPPGCGKTALARVIAGTTKSAFDTLNAVLSGVKELRQSISSAKERKELYDKRTILFVDEVHRWNKAQQDALLPWVENGTVILIGATTENPFFEVNPALVSRSRIFQLKPLSKDDLYAVAHQALNDRERGYGKWKVSFEEGALEHLISVASGDARSLLGALELAVETSVDSFPPQEGTELFVSISAAEESIQQKVVLYDKDGDYHFDVASAFIKSIRGSDPDAALYWMARMIRAGEDPRFIFRRMLISSCEDIGLADPHALGVVESAAAAFDRVGMPEGRFHLTHAVLYLATAPKSNSSLAFFDALKAVEEDTKSEVPNHLRDANRDKEGFGHGEGYLYPHAYRDHWVAQHYLPEQMRGRLFYRPSSQGYEERVRDQVTRRREAQLALGQMEDPGEILSFGKPSGKEARWLARLADNASENLMLLRKAIFDEAKPARHELVLDLRADDGLLLWEACRKSPEGGVWGALRSREALQRLEGYASTLDDPGRPSLFVAGSEPLRKGIPEEISFEVVIGRNHFLRLPESEHLGEMENIFSVLKSKGRVVVVETIPKYGMRLSDAVASIAPQEGSLIELLKKAEESIYETGTNDTTSWDEKSLTEHAAAVGFQVDSPRFFPLEEERTIGSRELKRWLSPSTEGGYGACISQLNLADIRETEKRLTTILAGHPIPWRRKLVLLKFHR
ncbi:AAA family ATPase [Sediminispirochaeta smaragdinae]|uniref:Replication-associated recombination protein A n=1 Tax=Sediminispirochaeta smaragdinae (strain DSM 11293 / JCM 15392 / SEBR 4228) TaxID=573413 RepID=E1R402_SEDSS|nr:AAA family ATPase [Sediminispirochaeta smaragdinae]ADK80424.1 AAA ATPase central domain protein [Sediminispirochaeta smaragdinae DSM 11293]